MSLLLKATVTCSFVLEENWTLGSMVVRITRRAAWRILVMAKLKEFV